MIFEIRSYHIAPERLADYRRWVAAAALPHLEQHLNVIGFWIGNDMASEIRGAPQDELGSANVTWIVGWNDIAARQATLDRVFSSPAWQKIFAQLPGGLANYRRMESKFAEQIP